jgi:hypothetical protein
LEAIEARARRALATCTKVIRDRAGSDCRIDETRAVSLAAGDGDERIAALDRAAIRGHSAHVEVGMTRIEFCVSGRYLAKLHFKLLISFPRLN